MGSRSMLLYIFLLVFFETPPASSKLSSVSKTPLASSKLSSVSKTPLASSKLSSVSKTPPAPSKLSSVSKTPPASSKLSSVSKTPLASSKLSSVSKTPLDASKEPKLSPLSQQHTLLHLEQQRQLQLQQRKLRAELVKQQLQQNSHIGGKGIPPLQQRQYHDWGAEADAFYLWKNNNADSAGATPLQSFLETDKWLPNICEGLIQLNTALNTMLQLDEGSNLLAVQRSKSSLSGALMSVLTAVEREISKHVNRYDMSLDIVKGATFGLVDLEENLKEVHTMVSLVKAAQIVFTLAKAALLVVPI